MKHRLVTLLCLLTLSGCKDPSFDSAGEVLDESAAPDFTCPERGGLEGALPAAWTRTSAAPGGDISAFSEGGGVLFAGSSSNGIYRLDGEGWSRLNTPVSHVQGQLAVNPNDPDLIVFPAAGMWITEDGGESWRDYSLLIEGAHVLFRGLAWHGDALYAVADGILYRSQDGLETLETIGAISGLRHGSWETSGDDWSLHSRDGALYALHQEGSLYRSLDDGESWTLLRDGAHTFGAFAISEGALWVGETYEIYRSVNDGESWERIDGIPDPITGLAASPDGQLAVTGAGGLWTLEDGVLISRETGGEGDALGVIFGPDGALYEGLTEGIWRSMDGGEVWADLSMGLLDVDLSTLLAHPLCADLLWAGTQCQRGVYQSTDWGGVWSHIPIYMHYVMVIQSNPSRPEEIWLTTDDKLFRSPDLGETWDTVNRDFMEVHLHGLAIDPFDPDRVLVGSSGSGDYADAQANIFLTEDGALNWEIVSEGLPVSEASLHVLHFSRERRDVVLAGSFRGGGIDHTGDPGFGLYRSIDGGYTWSKAALDALDVSQIEECDGRIYAATDAGVAISDDAGETWQIALEPIGDEYLSVACRGDLVLALDGARAISRSDDRGVTWIDWSDPLLPPGFNLEDQRLLDLAITADGAGAYVALQQLGVYLRAL